MAAEKKITSRIQQKHDTAANWAKATTFIPKKGEIVIYDAEYNTSGVQTQAVRFKIGDGSRTINNLPFALIDYDNRITSLESTVNGLGTAAQKDVGFFATAAQGTKADNAVPKTRKVNNKALSADIKLEPSDVGVTESAFPGLKKTGTITGITMNGASKGTSGVVDLGTVLTSSDNLAKLDTENTFTAKQTINSGYGTVSLKTQGYVEINASWLSGNLGGLLGIKRDDTSGRIYAVATKNLGLVSAIRINNSTKQPDGDCVVDLGTVLTTHQTIKTLNTDNNTSQTVSASESISGSGTINLHKVAKTGSYNDLLNKPTIPTDTGATSVEVTGTGNAVTAASYNATNRKLTLTKGSTFLTSHQDISGKANLAGNNTFTGGQTITGQTSDGYSVNASGYVKGSWLQSGVKSNKGSGTGMVCVFDSAGWIYYRTPSEILTEAGGAKASDIPTFELSGDTLIINF
jgi:hypothetical protein